MTLEKQVPEGSAAPSISSQPRRTTGASYLTTPPHQRTGRAATVEAVLCDLDDTLYPQAAWLEGAWRAVAAAAAQHGIHEPAFLAALQADAALGSARGGIIDRALAAVGVEVGAGVGVGVGVGVGTDPGGDAVRPDNLAGGNSAAGGHTPDLGIGPVLGVAATDHEVVVERVPLPVRDARGDSGHADSSHLEPGHADSGHADSSHLEPGHADSGPADSSHLEPGHAEPGPADSSLGRAAPSPSPDPMLLPQLVATFRAHRPTRLEPYPGVREALARLRTAGVRLAIVTDGDVDMQAWKVRALGLSAFFDCVVVSDALGGRAVRKPHSAPFLAALEGLGVAADRCVVVGDRPEKDVTGAAGVDIRAVRVKTGEYQQVPDAVGTWHSAPDFAAAVDWLLAA